MATRRGGGLPDALTPEVQTELDWIQMQGGTNSGRPTHSRWWRRHARPFHAPRRDRTGDRPRQRSAGGVNAGPWEAQQLQRELNGSHQFAPKLATAGNSVRNRGVPHAGAAATESDRGHRQRPNRPFLSQGIRGWCLRQRCACTSKSRRTWRVCLTSPVGRRCRGSRGNLRHG